jgi:hypothetical protein
MNTFLTGRTGRGGTDLLINRGRFMFTIIIYEESVIFLPRSSIVPRPCPLIDRIIAGIIFCRNSRECRGVVANRRVKAPLSLRSRRALDLLRAHLFALVIYSLSTRARAPR